MNDCLVMLSNIVSFCCGEEYEDEEDRRLPQNGYHRERDSAEMEDDDLQRRNIFRNQQPPGSQPRRSPRRTRSRSNPRRNPQQNGRVFPTRSEMFSFVPENPLALTGNEIIEFQIRDLDSIIKEDCANFKNSKFFLNHFKSLREDTKPECPVCFESFEEDEILLTLLPCSHIICRECVVKRWFEPKFNEFKHRLENWDGEEEIEGSSVRCPICRFEIKLSKRHVIDNKRVRRIIMVGGFKEIEYELLLHENSFQQIFIHVSEALDPGNKINNEKIKISQKLKILKTSNSKLFAVITKLDDPKFSKFEKKKNLIKRIQVLQKLIDEKEFMITAN